MRHTQIVTFDMDGSLTETHVQLLLERHLFWGDEVHIVTSRKQAFDNVCDDILELINEFSISKSRVHYTNHNLKLETLLKIGSNLHYDDDVIEVDDINTNGGETIKAILVGYIHKYK